MGLVRKNKSLLKQRLSVLKRDGFQPLPLSLMIPYCLSSFHTTQSRLLMTRPIFSLTVLTAVCNLEASRATSQITFWFIATVSTWHVREMFIWVGGSLKVCTHRALTRCWYGRYTRYGGSSSYGFRSFVLIVAGTTTVCKPAGIRGLQWIWVWCFYIVYIRR